MPVTPNSRLLATSGSDGVGDKAFTAALHNLRARKRALWDRGARGLCLWPHTSVNLDKAYDDAKRATASAQRIAPFVKEFLETRPIVARRHYIQTGNMRHWDVRYCSVAALPREFDKDPTNADGVIL